MFMLTLIVCQVMMTIGNNVEFRDNCMHTISKTPTGLKGGLSWYKELYRRLIRAADAFLIWYDRSRERQALLSMDDHMLHDIGLSRADIWDEARKPFWLE